MNGRCNTPRQMYARPLGGEAWTQAEWDWFHNPECPPAEERKIDAIYYCAALDSTNEDN